MSDVALPELKLVDPPTGERWLAWTTLASLLGHAFLLALVLWAPLRDVVEPEPPQAIEVELVEPPEADTPKQATPEETPGENKDTPADQAPQDEAPKEEATKEEAPAEPAAAPRAAPADPVETAATPPAASAPPPPAPEASTDTAGEPPPAAEVASTPPPAPLPRPAATATTEPGKASAPSGEPVAALSAETGDAEGARPDALSADPGLAALDLGQLRTADRFYLEAMLQQPGLARARDMLPTLPRDKRLAQTCNIEALAQIGNSGEGFAPDVVMADAYAQSILTDNGLSANGAVFRSRGKWYGLAFDCSLSDDLTQVTAFSYRLGADVTDAVLARLERR